MSAIPTNFVDNIGMFVNAAYLNNLGTEVNNNIYAKTLWGTRAAMPAASSSNNGGTYRCTDCSADYYSDGTKWTKVRMNGLYTPGLADPPTTGLTAYGAGGTITTDGDSRLLTTTGTNSVAFGEYATLSPTTNYTARAYIDSAIILSVTVPGIRLGLAVFDSAGTKAISWGLNNTTSLDMVHWANTTSPTDVYTKALNASSLYAVPNWFQIRDDGTNLNYEFSYNGLDWILATSEARTSFLTAAKVGFLAYWNLTGQTQSLKVRLRSLNISTP